MNRIDLSNRFAEMWSASRSIAGLSQEHMAKALGVSRKTVQNWENGTSCPSQIVGLEWFEVCGLNPLPFYLNLLFPNDFNEISDDNIDDALMLLIKSLPMDRKMKLLYLFNGPHGSSPSCVLEMVTAHLQVPLSNRLSIAETIYSNYDMASATGSIRNQDMVQPDTRLLKNAIETARESIKHGHDGYANIGGML